MIENVSAYFNSGLESDAVITTDSGSKSVKVIYYDEYQAADIVGIEVANSNPEAHIQTADLPGDIKNQDEITITGFNNGDPFKISFPLRPNGTGITVMILSYD